VPRRLGNVHTFGEADVEAGLGRGQEQAGQADVQGQVLLPV
jgi:hypothetical protein